MNQVGKKVFLWYRIYCGAMALLYLFVLATGVLMLTMPFETNREEAAQLVFIGTLNSVIGALFFPTFVVASFLPPKMYNWIVGIILIAIGLTSCCTWPATIPLLIYWIKPETQSFFGRKTSL